MFEGLLVRLRAEGVPVAMDQWLVLQRALEAGLAGPGLGRFYLTARALLVTSERDYDRYDVAFSRYFSGLDPVGDDIADRVWEWLADDPGALRLSPEQRARLDALMEHLDPDEIRRRFEERLTHQDEAHRGGSRHIGTQGTSPFGHSGHHPGGIRVGGASHGRSAAQVAAERRWRAYRDDTTIGVREFATALRRLRMLSTRLEGPATELDVDATIDATADAGGRLDIVYRRPRRNALRVLLLLDVGGSMDEHADIVDRLFSAVHQASHFRELHVRYFHNCVYDDLYLTADARPDRVEPTRALLARLSPETRLVVVGDACMAPSELAVPGGAIDYWVHNEEPGWVWLERLRDHFPHAAWLNPVPVQWWEAVRGARTLQAVRSLYPMFELSLAGLEAAVAHLMLRAAA